VFSRKTISEDVREAERNIVESVSYTRPEINWGFSQSLSVHEGIVTPVFRTFEKEGVKVSFGVDEHNQVFGHVLIPGDTVKKETSQFESIVEYKIKIEEESQKDIERKGLNFMSIIGWIVVILVFVIIGSYFIKNKLW
jgi:aspartokinase